MKKYYKDTDGYPAETLWEAIVKPYERGCQSPPQIEKWIEVQADAYMQTDYDEEWKEVSEPCTECGHKTFSRDRYDWANERASDDFDVFIDDIDRKDDKQVAEFFNISWEVTAYELDNGDKIEAENVIGECSNCRNVIDKDMLFDYNEDLKEHVDMALLEACSSKAIGICRNCGEELLAREITDKDIAVAVSL